MNARELAEKIAKQELVLSGFMQNGDEDTIIRALRLLAAAEANDGTTPEVSAWRLANLPTAEIFSLAECLERERNGLAAKVGELEADAERYQFLRDSESNLLALMEERGK